MEELKKWLLEHQYTLLKEFSEGAYWYYRFRYQETLLLLK